MILHIIGRADWAAARTAGVIRPAAGAPFVHCADLGSVRIPANKFYAGHTDLLLLVIDPALAGSPVRWEPGDPPEPDGPWFPHVYGPIPVPAVVAEHEFAPAADGRFELPESLARPRAT